jgi:hypothetical protein
MVKKLKLKKADWPKSEKLSYTPIDPFVALVVPEPDFTICKHLLLHGRHDVTNLPSPRGLKPIPSRVHFVEGK